MVVERLLVVDYWLGFEVDYSGPTLVDYWGMASWDNFVVQILVLTKRVEQGSGLEPLALVVHNKFGWVTVPQMWAFSLHTIVLAKPLPEPAAVAQVVHRTLFL